jgi:hypothetical protein
LREREQFVRLGHDKRFDDRNVGLVGAGRMVLDPLAEVGVGMLMAVMVRRSQLVVNRERGRERGERQEDHGDAQGYGPASHIPS